MSDGLIVAALAGVTIIAAILSFVAWNLLGRRPEPTRGETRPPLDSEDPHV